MPLVGFERLYFIFFSSCSNFLEHRADFSDSFIIFKDGRTPWTGDQLVARPLPKHRTTQTKHPCLVWDSKPRSRLPGELRQYMPLDRSATVTGFLRITLPISRYILSYIPHFLRNLASVTDLATCHADCADYRS
jgi:hypothetical protein